MLSLLRTCLSRWLLITPLFLVACGGSDGGGTPPPEDRQEPPVQDDDTDDDTTGDETPTDDEPTPAEAFAIPAQLEYSHSYSGEANWAQPMAADMDHVQLLDTANLGSALLVVPYFVAAEFFADAEVGPDELLAFIEVLNCSDSSAKPLSTPSETLASDCLRSPSADNSEITYSGQLQWHPEGSEDFTAELELTALELTWRGEDFELSGAMALDGDLSNLFIALDITHLNSNVTYRYWARHNYSLSEERPQIDLVSFHPDQGAVVQMGEGAYAETSDCAQGGFQAEAGALMNAHSANASTATLYYLHTACDVFRFQSMLSDAVDVDSVPPRVHASYASLGLDFGVKVDWWAAQPGHELAGNSSDEVLTPEVVDVARLGTETDGDDWVQYNIALSYDLSELPDSVINGNTLAAQWQGFQVSGQGSTGTINRIVLADWQGEPEASEFVGNEANTYDHMAALEGDNEAPWWSSDITALLEVALNEGRSHMTIVVTSMFIIEPEEGDFVRELCLQETEDCSADLLPNISIAYRDLGPQT